MIRTQNESTSNFPDRTHPPQNIKKKCLTLSVFFFVFTCTMIASCSRIERLTESKLSSDIRSSNHNFLHAEDAMAKKSLIDFIKQYDTHTPAERDRKNHRLNYLLGMYWLRLYSMYYCENNSDLSCEAMNKAIFYFDKDEDASASKERVDNKEKKLHDFIFGIYHYDVSPKWYWRYKTHELPVCSETAPSLTPTTSSTASKP